MWVQTLDPSEQYAGAKKNGFFHAEQPYFVEIAESLGLLRRKDNSDYWCRHPLAFLVEAADDTCYAIIDIEDGYELKYLSYDEAMSILEPIAGNVDLSNASEPATRVAKLRAVAIGILIRDAAGVFLRNEGSILEGVFPDELLRLTKFSQQIANAKELAKKRLYWSDRKTKLEIASTEIISGLLNIFSEVVSSLANVNYDGAKLTGKPQQLARLMGATLMPAHESYEALLCVTDFVSGMTDRYAVDLYRSLTGISIGP